MFMNTKTPECWGNDPQAQALRIEISPERSLLLPFEQFVFAELTHEAKSQKLRLVFVTHEVVVRGQVLRRIETALQRRELSNLQMLARHHRVLVPDGQPNVSDISIVELSASESNEGKP
jgi:hypothetical protein